MKYSYVAISLALLYIYLFNRMTSVLSEEDKKKFLTQGVSKYIVMACAAPMLAIPFFNDQTVKFALLAFVLISSALLEPINHRKLLASGLPASFLRKMRLLGFISMPATIFFLLEYWH
ncbi:MAG: hypothetical protein LBJ40_25665 [Delftia acidovorans]|nr:hypothetical protein [Delftia acidovorans]